MVDWTWRSFHPHGQQLQLKQREELASGRRSPWLWRASSATVHTNVHRVVPPQSRCRLVSCGWRLSVGHQASNLLQKADRDGDGRISRSEFVPWFEQMVAKLRDAGLAVILPDVAEQTGTRHA